MLSIKVLQINRSDSSFGTCLYKHTYVCVWMYVHYNQMHKLNVKQLASIINKVLDDSRIINIVLVMFSRAANHQK